ncbi:MAG TPA: hypothetical protein VMZ91_13595 [Candidatus Paceibacterota bacterium]|nr:hypothetical protein [Candidatus Paceibacterota bacterium]
MMPYLTQENKDYLNEENHLSSLARTLSEEPVEKFVGELNYMNFLFVKRWIKKNGKKYFVFAAIIGTLICCVFEIYRKLIAPYEEIKEKENGSIE